MKVVIERHPMGHCFEVFQWGHGAPMVEPRDHNRTPARAWQFATAELAAAALRARWPDVEIIDRDHLTISKG